MRAAPRKDRSLKRRDCSVIGVRDAADMRKGCCIGNGESEDRMYNQGEAA
jgi:hypothetical protein